MGECGFSLAARKLCDRGRPRGGGAAPAGLMRLLFRRRWLVTMGSISISSWAGDDPPTKEDEAAEVEASAAAAGRADTGSSRRRGDAASSPADKGEGFVVVDVEMGGSLGGRLEEEGAEEGVEVEEVRVGRGTGMVVLW